MFKRLISFKLIGRKRNTFLESSSIQISDFIYFESDFLPFCEIKLNDICFDPKVQTYCNNQKFRCPNYNNSWACPPESPYMKEIVSQFDKFFLIYFKFNLKEHLNGQNLEIDKRSFSNSFYRNELVRDYLEKEIIDFLENYKEDYNDKLILWDGYCRVCSKEGRKCTYYLKKPCRYPTDIRFSMEAVGIDVDKTVKNLDFALEWPPLNYVYRFGLVCFK